LVLFDCAKVYAKARAVHSASDDAAQLKRTVAVTSNDIRRVGMIGLGKMGAPMARHLVKRGFTVAGFDITEAAMESAAEAGVQTALSPQAVAAASDLVIIVVGFDQEVEAVIFGERGVLAGARDGSVIAIASTIAPRTMQRIAARLPASPKVALLDIPLCRGEGPAQQGELLVMGGGDRAAFDACRPALEAFATSIHYLGPAGAGQVGKMVNNLILWACISANEEGFKLAETLGVERETLRTALLDSSAGNWSLETRPEEKPMPWAEKDMTIVLKEAEAARLSLPLCAVVKDVIKTVKQERGWPTPKAPGD
jgi:3-hydroxyisobutyrate dehydrogenase-like beta-hydroxyacid dehydrogenase